MLVYILANTCIEYGLNQSLTHLNAGGTTSNFCKIGRTGDESCDKNGAN